MHQPRRRDVRSGRDSLLGLRRDHGCVRDLMWRCDLPDETGLDAFVRALEHAGFRLDDPGPLLRILRRPDGDAIVIVPRTRRVQVRVGFAVPMAERAHRAGEIAAVIARAAGEVGNTA